MARDLLQDAELYDPSIKQGMKFTPFISAITANYQLTVEHPTLLFLDPNGGSKDVLLPAEADSEGLFFLISNTADASETLIVKEDSDTTTIASVVQNAAGLFWCDGTTWYGYTFLGAASTVTIANLTVASFATLLAAAEGIQHLSGAGAVSVTQGITLLTTTGADALTLVDGLTTGHKKAVIMIADGGDGTLTPTNFGNGTTMTFADVGDSVTLIWDATGGNWWIESNNGVLVA